MSSQFHSKHVLAAAAAATTLTLIGCSGMPTNNAAPESPAVVTVTETSPASLWHRKGFFQTIIYRRVPVKINFSGNGRLKWHNE